MIRWKSRSEYYNRLNGLQISRTKANRDYTILKKYKIYDTRDCRINERGEKSGDGTIVWINECEPKRQLTIFGVQKTN